MENIHVIYVNFDEQPAKEKLWQEFIKEGRFLTPREMDLFYLLYENKNMIISKKMMIDKLYKFSADGSVRNRVKELRNRLKGSKYEIKTFPAMGYRLEYKSYS